MSITATIITLNEAENIAECIWSIKPVCNEIIVVDSGSHDDTVAIARSLGARVYEQPYLGDGPQKAFGVQFSSNDWILSIDADERLEDDAVRDILALDLSDERYDAYAFRRRNFVGNHWIRAAGFYPDVVTRLYDRRRCRYLPRKAHSRIDVKNVKILSSHIRHLTYADYTDWLKRINELSSRDAWVLTERGKRIRVWTPGLHAGWSFVRKMILKGGIFQGLDGMTVAVTTATHVYFKYLKALEMQENENC